MALRVYPKSSDKLVSKHFHSFEFDCPCARCTETFIEEELVEMLEVMRDILGVPLEITSGYRCAFHQEQLRKQNYETSRGRSQHEFGRAADVVTGKHKTEDLISAALKAGFHAIGAGLTNWIHVDLRYNGKDLFWTYSKH